MMQPGNKTTSGFPIDFHPVPGLAPWIVAAPADKSCPHKRNCGLSPAVQTRRTTQSGTATWFTPLADDFKDTRFQHHFRVGRQNLRICFRALSTLFTKSFSAPHKHNARPDVFGPLTLEHADVYL
jgi:hypothetical protein